MNEEQKKNLKIAAGVVLGYSFLKQRRDVRVIKSQIGGLSSVTRELADILNIVTVMQSNHQDYLVWLGDIMPDVVSKTGAKVSGKASKKALKAVS